MVMNSKAHRKDGSTAEVWYNIPDKTQSSLRYHRYYNISRIVDKDPKLAFQLAESYAQHLCAKEADVVEVQISNVVHMPLTPGDAKHGGDPNGLSTYVRPVVFGSWRCM